MIKEQQKYVMYIAVLTLLSNYFKFMEQFYCDFAEIICLFFITNELYRISWCIIASIVYPEYFDYTFYWFLRLLYDNAFNILYKSIVLTVSDDLECFNFFPTDKTLKSHFSSSNQTLYRNNLVKDLLISDLCFGVKANHNAFLKIFLCEYFNPNRLS